MMGGERPSEKLVKNRISVTMTELYINALDHLVEEGFYLTRGEIVLEALRNIFKEKGVARFKKPLEEPR